MYNVYNRSIMLGELNEYEWYSDESIDSVYEHNNMYIISNKI